MKLLQKALNKFNGLHYSQEYLCLAKEPFEHPLHLYFISNNRVIKDISYQHLFVGYSPLIFALPQFVEIDQAHLHNISILFTSKTLAINEIVSKKDAIATLELKQIHQEAADNDTIYFYEGVKGIHHFVSPFHQLILSLNNKLFNKKPGNVFLPGNLYEQVQIAYSIPRKISLITVKQNNLFNLFPTDLHGEISENRYLISLRQGGKAAQQTDATMKILLSDVRADFYKTVYSLGKNHMQEPKGKETFPFSNALSEKFGLPLPEQTLCYRELEVIDSFIHGIHKIFILKTLSNARTADIPSTLAHVHNIYATWRYNKGLGGNYLLR